MSKMSPRMTMAHITLKRKLASIVSIEERVVGQADALQDQPARKES
jgi:hypothetical protein